MTEPNFPLNCGSNTTMHFRCPPQCLKYLAYFSHVCPNKNSFLMFQPFSLFCFKVWPRETWTQRCSWSLRNEEHAPSVGDKNSQPSQRGGTTHEHPKPPTLRALTELSRLWVTYFFILIGCALIIWLDAQQVFLCWPQLMQFTDWLHAKTCWRTSEPGKP